MPRVLHPGACLVAAAVAACSTPVESRPVAVALTGPGPFIVSNPVALGTASSGGAAGSSTTGVVTFVSLPPGTLTAGTWVAIRVKRTGAQVTGALVDGGLDPVAVPALAGDTLTLTVNGAGAPGEPWVFTVPPRRPPSIVRTGPRPNRRDVALNLRLEVVFSEPVDLATLTHQTVTLHAGGHTVAGEVTFGNPEHTVIWFTPSAPLLAATDYVLTLGTGIRDLEGAALEAGTSVAFSTAAATTPAGAIPVSVSNPVDGMAFVSLAPGVLSPLTRIRIRVLGTGKELVAALVDGGLDPVPVPAVAGDVLSVQGIGGNPAPPTLATVPEATAPTIIRRSHAGQQDVALNARVEVVFSEPVDVATLTPERFGLLAGGQPVAGQVTFGDAYHTIVQFAPVALLAPGTQYALEVGDIRDRDGTSIGAGESSAFTTAPLLTQQLAFVREGQIHVVREDGRLVQLTSTARGVTNGDPAWSPDGQRLAFVRSDRPDLGNAEIYVMNADGSHEVRYTNGGMNLDPAWAPDGRTIAFTGLGFGSAAIRSVDVSDGQGKGVLHDNPGYDAQPAWSPDGRTIAFTSDWRAYDFLFDLYLMDADGSNIRPVVEGPFFGEGGLAFYFQSAWSPDGQKLAAVRCGWAWDTCYPGSEIVVVNADGTGLRHVVHAGGFASPTWSPDGRAIAFGSATCPQSALIDERYLRSFCSSSIRLVWADGSSEVPIVSNGHSPAWRPQPRD